jgi:phosphatidylethanolamine-binding protein (PEBP) family uncharacterized protein
MTITLRSPAFADRDTIPGVYTCNGDDVSPPLEWSGVPADAAQPGLGRGQVPAGGAAGTQRLRSDRLGRPVPAEGNDPHRYVFTLLALSNPLAVEAGAAADPVKRAAEGEVLAEGRLTAWYRR